MNYLDDELLDALAARYVLGTMTGLARVRFDRLKLKYAKVNERVHYWEQLLAPLNDHLDMDSRAAGQSKLRTWLGVSRRLGFEPQGVDTQSPSQIAAKGFYWRWLTACSSGVAAVLCLVLLWTVSSYDSEIVDLKSQLQTQSLLADGDGGTTSNPPVNDDANSGNIGVPDTGVAMTGIAVINNEDNLPLWVIELVDSDIRIQATAAIVQSSQYDYELWFVGNDGQQPVSLGVIPQSGQLKQPCPDIFNTQHLSALAISREEPGGSQSGQPGQVLYSTAMIAI